MSDTTSTNFFSRAIDWLRVLSFRIFIDTFGKRAREERFIHRILMSYPTLADRPKALLYDACERVRTRLGWRVLFTCILAGSCAMVVVQPAFVLLRMFGVSLFTWQKAFVMYFACFAAWHFMRRWFITRSIDRAVAETYPDTFCPCGYCLMGLLASSACPECGKQR